MAESITPIVKRSPVTRMYQVNLYCNICGQMMQRDPSAAVLMTNPPQIPYICPMGHTLRTNMQFPFQQVEFDETQAEPLEFQMAPASSSLLVPPGTQRPPQSPKPTSSDLLSGSGASPKDVSAPKLDCGCDGSCGDSCTCK